MNQLTEKRYHLLFEIGVWVKAIDGMIEAILGVALYYVSSATVDKIAQFFLGDEITETPRDIFWNYIVNEFHRAAAIPRSFWAFLFLTHGLIKLFLVAGLFRKKLWAYPAAASVFGLFVVYQIYQLTLVPSIFLGLITAVDVAIVYLILHEYGRVRRMGQASAGL